jgi:hypothetical protein
MKLKERYKSWAPYINTDGAMYIVMFLIIGIGVAIMVIFF